MCLGLGALSKAYYFSIEINMEILQLKTSKNPSLFRKSTANNLSK